MRRQLLRGLAVSAALLGLAAPAGAASIGVDFSFQNTDVVVQTFQLSFQMPVNQSAPSTFLGGSVGISVTDASNDGLGGMATVGPRAFYTGVIDGMLVEPQARLLPHPSSLNFLFPGQSNVISSSFGLPGNTVAGPALSDNIGIFFRFSLSPGDSIAVTALFNVEPIPEPGSMALFACGLLTALAATRRWAV